MKDNLSEQQQIIDVTPSSEVAFPIPSDIYEQAKRRRKMQTKAFICILLVVELIVAGFYVQQIKINQIDERLSKEYENLQTGQISTDNGVFIGSSEFGLFDGEGIFEFDSGAFYQGEWSQNIISGQGTIQFPSQGTYTGEFRNNRKSGQGIFHWDDGAVYEGEWLNDAMNGQGSYVSQDGVSYNGTFKNNAFSDGDCAFTNATGEYVLTYTNGDIDNATITYSNGIIYNGDCDGTALEGFGVMTYPNEDVYAGAYSASLRSGQGIYTWSNGDKYDGEWMNDSMNGTGTYTFTNGNYFSGTFSDNTFLDGSYHVTNDFGTYIFTVKNGDPTAVSMTLSDGTKYDGDLTAEGKLTGSAQIQYSNGDKYSGKVTDGLKSGQGQYTWSSGASYDGAWENDKMDGQGTYIYPSSETGYKLTGTFSGGVPSGECYYYTSTSTKYKTDWSRGRCVKIYE